MLPQIPSSIPLCHLCLNILFPVFSLSTFIPPGLYYLFSLKAFSTFGATLKVPDSTEQIPHFPMLQIKHTNLKIIRYVWVNLFSLFGCSTSLNSYLANLVTPLVIIFSNSIYLSESFPFSFFWHEGNFYLQQMRPAIAENISLSECRVVMPSPDGLIYKTLLPLRL